MSREKKTGMISQFFLNFAKFFDGRKEKMFDMRKTALIPYVIDDRKFSGLGISGSGSICPAALQGQLLLVGVGGRGLVRPEGLLPRQGGGHCQDCRGEEGVGDLIQAAEMMAFKMATDFLQNWLYKILTVRVTRSDF